MSDHTASDDAARIDVTAIVAELVAMRDRCNRVLAMLARPATPSQPPNQEIKYNLTLQQAAGKARMTDTAFKLYLRRYGEGLGRKRLGRWEVSAEALHELLATGTIRC
jgi:hypothetical protein